MTSLRCALYKLPASSKGDTIFDAFNTQPPYNEYSDYMYWNNVKNDYVVASSNVILGTNNGTTGRELYTIAIGYGPGHASQSTNAISIGHNAGYQTQGISAIAIGNQAGYQTQQANAIAMGNQSGEIVQQANAIAIGLQAGQNNQGTNALAIGVQAGQLGQQANAIAIGLQAGQNNQGNNSVSIGYQAGQTNQGPNSIDIGQKVIVNSSASIKPGFFIKPIIRGPAGLTNVLSYNTATGEVFFNSSSKRFKYDIQPTTLNTDHIYQVEPKEFKYNMDNTTDVGFIAEEMAKIEPKFVYTDKEDKPEGICWNVITLSLVEEMKKLAKRRDALKQEIQELICHMNCIQNEHLLPVES